VSFVEKRALRRSTLRKNGCGGGAQQARSMKRRVSSPVTVTPCSFIPELLHVAMTRKKLAAATQRCVGVLLARATNLMCQQMASRCQPISGSYHFFLSFCIFDIVLLDNLHIIPNV
jgi:hypothetical protein